MPTINFADVEELKPIPPGKYSATIVKATEGISKAGNEKIDLQYRIEGAKFDGRIVFDTLTFTAKALFRVKNTLRGLGFPAKFKGEVNPGDLVGKSAKIVVDIQPGNGVDEDGDTHPARNRVKKVTPI